MEKEQDSSPEAVPRKGIKHWPEGDRPREKLLEKGPGVLSDSELIAILIRSGSTINTAMDVARSILGQVNNDLDRLAQLNVADLLRMKVNGLGKTKAITIMAALELGRRRRALAKTERALVTNSLVAYEIVRPMLADKSHEEFWLLLLDRGNRLKNSIRVSQGGMHGTIADPKLIFKMALEERASSIVLCHNHPSGQLRPSEEDIRLTRKLVDGAQLLDLSVMDHIIVTTDGHFSFADNGML